MFQPDTASGLFAVIIGLLGSDSQQEALALLASKHNSVTRGDVSVEVLVDSYVKATALRDALPDDDEPLYDWLDDYDLDLALLLEVVPSTVCWTLLPALAYRVKPQQRSQLVDFADVAYLISEAMPSAGQLDELLQVDPRRHTRLLGALTRVVVALSRKRARQCRERYKRMTSMDTTLHNAFCQRCEPSEARCADEMMRFAKVTDRKHLRFDSQKILEGCRKP